MTNNVPLVSATAVTSEQPQPGAGFAPIPVVAATQIYPEFSQVKSVDVPQQFASVISPGGYYTIDKFSFL